MNLSELSTKEITNIFNRLAPVPVNRFETRAVAIRRTQLLIDADTAEFEAAAERGANAMLISDAEFEADAAGDAELAEVVEAAPSEGGSDSWDAWADADTASKALADVARYDARKAAAATHAVSAPSATYTEAFASLKAAGTPKPAKPAKAPAEPATERSSELGLTGSKYALLQMLKRETGVNQAEGCKALDWAKCTSTIGRVIKIATDNGWTERRWKAVDGKTRYAISRSA